MWRKSLQLGLLHTAVALLTLPVDDNLNRVMNVELGLPLTLVTALISLPYLVSPLQVWFGAWADRHPVLGRRRTPYALAGLLVCAAGVVVLPVGLLQTEGPLGLLIAFAGFVLWGLGYNITTVAYFSLASELFEPQLRSRAVAVMYFVMLLSVIAGGIGFGRMVAGVPDTAAALAGPLTRAIWVIAAIAVAFGVLGTHGLEPRGLAAAAGEPLGFGRLWAALAGNRNARLFFIYLTLLLIAILGQDVILEPFGGLVLGMSLEETARLRSIYGVCFLLALVVAAVLERFLSRRRVGLASAVAAMAAFVVLALSSLWASTPLFYTGLVVLGLAIGVSTVSNHAFMLDMTTPRDVGLFIGAWGLAVSLARLLGGLINGVVRDGVGQVSDAPALGFAAVFALQLVLLIGALAVLARLPDLRLDASAPLAGSLAERAAAASAE